MILVIIFLIKKIVKGQIILDAKASINIKNYTPIFDNKYICISEIDEYLTDNIATMHNNIKNIYIMRSLRSQI